MTPWGGPAVGCPFPEPSLSVLELTTNHSGILREKYKRETEEKRNGRKRTGYSRKRTGNPAMASKAVP